MIEKTKILIKKNIKLVSIIMILVILAITFFSIGAITKNIWNTNNKKAENVNEISYKIYKVNKKIATVVVMFENENGMESIQDINNESKDKIINCNGKTKVAIDYEMEDLKSYKFKVTYVNGEQKELTIDFELPRIKGRYTLKNGIYVNEPDLSTGFAKEKARYLYLDGKQNLIPGNWITEPEPQGWYDYKEQKWANIYVESDGNSAYYVWIPRYAYKPSAGNITGSERADVIFIDTQNNYKYIDAAGQEQIKTWEELEAENYVIPDAFAWGDDDSDSNVNTQIPGYWVSKYVLGEISNLVVQYDFATDNGGVLISNIVTNITNIKNSDGQAVTIGKYEFAMNGRVTDVFTSKPESYTFAGMKKGMNTFTVTLLDQNEEIIGSMTKEFEATEPNAPDLEGFDKQNTYYVTYDENENEHSTIPLTEPPPTDWYAYETRQWANIVVRQNGAETYYTWIPRYAYKTSGERASVKFLKGTSSDIPEGYIIPDAFGWGDDDNNRTQNTQLTGYWITKYVLGESNTLDVNIEYTTTSGTITTQGLTGTGIATGQKYFYWIDGKFIKETADSTEKITYSGLETGKIYTILIEIRDSANALIGTITKEAKTTIANAPVLAGFDNDETDGDNTMTYYVTYGEDGNGEEDSSRPITQIPPHNWYDYSEKRWANIVVRKTDADGNIVSETYYIWIPRYAYRVVNDKQRVDVIFLPGIESDIPPDYILPDAFGWGDDDTNVTNNTPIKGYWITKYVLGE